MNYQELYKTKICTADEAISAIKSGDTIVMAQTAGSPLLVSEALERYRERFADVKVYHMLSLSKGEYMRPECYGHFRHIGNFLGGNSRKAVMDGAADFIPCFFYEVPKMFGGAIPVDVAVVTLSEPDEDGYCSFGVSCDYAKSATEKAKVVIAEINCQMPHTFGNDNRIHVSKIDYIIPCDYAIPEIPRPTISEVERSIGQYCASLVKDGSTLQFGIGAIPDAVALFLKDKKHLGVHTEMFSDSVVDLVEAGVVDNSKKNIHKGKIISGL